METVTIKGQTYTVINRRTPADLDSSGCTATADWMRKNGAIADLIIRKPKGNRLFTIYQFTSGAFGRIIGPF